MSRFLGALQAFLFLLLVKTPSFCYAQVEDSWDANEGLVQEGIVTRLEAAKMNFTIPGVGNPLDTLVGAEVLIKELGAYRSDVAYLFSVLPDSYFDRPCRDQSFGLNGEWTDMICDAAEKSETLCRQEESFCPDPIPDIVAVKGSMFKNMSVETAASLFCTYLGRCDQEALVGELYYLIEKVVPNGWDNVLLTNRVGINKDDPNNNYIMGDGSFEIQEDFLRNTFGDDDLYTYQSLLVKRFATTGVVPDRTLNQNGVTQNDLEYGLWASATRGYYFQKYDLLTNEERKKSVQFFEKGGSYSKCGEVFGMLAASKCGYNAGDLKGLTEYYYSTLGNHTDEQTGTEYACSRFTEKHYIEANQVMNSKKYNRKKPVASVAKCIDVLKLGPKKKNKKKKSKSPKKKKRSI